ncbi:MAG: META domain-containing protein [Pseudomonadota bacterium]
MVSPFVKLIAFCAVTGGGLAQAENLPGSEWEPTELGSETFHPVAEIFLRFGPDSRYFGNGGCNMFRGAFVTNGSAILLGPAAATMMACPDDISRQEFAFLDALMTVREFERAGATLMLMNATGDKVLALRQRDAD